MQGIDNLPCGGDFVRLVFCVIASCLISVDLLVQGVLNWSLLDLVWIVTVLLYARYVLECVADRPFRNG